MDDVPELKLISYISINLMEELICQKNYKSYGLISKIGT